jgi:formate/nitrite transporter FocA (FNT family)
MCDNRLHVTFYRKHVDTHIATHAFDGIFTDRGRPGSSEVARSTPGAGSLHRDRATLRNVARLWTVVLISNLLGTLAISWVLANTAIFHPGARKAFADIGRESLSATVPDALLRGIFAGWLIAFMVWLLPSAEASRVLVIVALTWLVGAGQLTHVIAGSIEVLYLAASGVVSYGHVALAYMAPTLVGNIIGGVALVAALNHAQVVSK